MSGGTSWQARGTDLARIKLALERGDIVWCERCDNWLRKNFDRTRFSQRVVNGLIADHVKTDNPVVGQKNAPGTEFDVFFYVEIVLDDQVRFIKFVIEPEEDDNPGLVVISTHPPH